MSISHKITVSPSRKKPRSIIQKITKGFSRLGREIKISPKSNINHNSSGYKIEYFIPTVDVVIGIGKDHVAYLIMSEDAWKELQNTKNSIDITTTKKFEKEFL